MAIFKRITFLTLLILFIPLIGAMLLTGCWPTSNQQQQQLPPAANTLALNFASEIPDFDPAISYDTVSATVIYQIYETLYEYDYLKRPFTLRPLLAEDMPIIKDGGTHITIKIKKNIQYYPDPAFAGQPRYVQAQDFINQIKRLNFIPLNSAGRGLFADKIKGLEKFRKLVGSDFAKFKSEAIEGLTAVNDSTLVIELEQPSPSLIFSLAMVFTSPIPMEVLEYYHNNLSKNLIGTGPYYLAAITDNQVINLKKNPFFREAFYPSRGDRLANDWGLLEDAGKKIPFLEEINFYFQADAQKSWEMFLQQDLHILSLPQGHNQLVLTATGKLNPELKRKHIRLQISPTLTYWWLSFNMQDPIWGKNKLLRQAVAHAINIEKLVQLHTYNTGQMANSIFPPGILGYRPTKELPYQYDVAKAKQLLAAAGHPGGRNLLPLVFDLRDNSPSSVAQGEFVRDSLQAIGIKVRLQINTFNEFLKKSNAGKLQFWYDGWALDYPDAENILQLLSLKNFPPGPNSTYYTNHEVEKLINQVAMLSDGKEKDDLLDKIEQIVNADLPWIMLFYSRKYLLYHNMVKNYRHSDIIYNHFKYLKISR